MAKKPIVQDIESDLDDPNEDLDRVTQTNVNNTNKVSIKAASVTYIEQWVNRRRMAWLALISIIVITLLALFWISETRLTNASDVLTWFFITMSSIVGAYMGLSTWASIYKK